MIPRSGGDNTAAVRIVRGNCALEVVLGDITREATEVIANAANSSLAGGGGVDGAIHRAAGPELARALDALRPTLDGGRLATGGAVITPGFRLGARWVIHCVGPVYAAEGERAPALLASCYAEALRLCRAHGVDSIAFPSISTGAYGYPVAAAAEVAVGEVWRGLAHGTSPSLCRFVLFDAATLAAYEAAVHAVAGAS